MTEDLGRALRGSGYFAELGDADLARVAAAGQRRSLLPGEVLFREQEDAAGLVLILAGYLHLLRGAPDGRGQILRRCGPGDTLNDAPAFDGGPNAATAVAESRAEVWILPHHVLRELIAGMPGIAQGALGHLAQRLRHLVDLAGDLALLPVPVRIAKLLLRLAGAGDLIPHDITQEEIAEMTGTVRQVANRVIAEFAHSGLIAVDRRQIRIVDRDHLRDVAEGLVRPRS